MKQGDRPGHILNRETGEIVELNDPLRRVKRLRKRVSRWGREIAERYIRDGRGVMLLVSLTYRPGEVPQPGDRKEFMRKVRRKMGSKLIAYCVVAELQKRGVLHYHFLLLIRRGAWLPTPDKGHLWTHGSTNVKRNVRSPGYLLKYVSKVENGGYDLPIGTRAYDVRVRQVDDFAPGAIVALRLSTVPYWLEKLIGEDCIDHGKFPARRRGGGWQLEDQVYFSPWVYVPEKTLTPAGAGQAISSSVA